MPNQDYPGKARELAKRGRYGDSMLMHVNPLEVAMLAKTGRITINPDTGMPEAFFFLLPLLASLGSAAAGAAGAIGAGLAAGAGAVGAGLGAIGSGLAAGASAVGGALGLGGAGAAAGAAGAAGAGAGAAGLGAGAGAAGAAGAGLGAAALPTGLAAALPTAVLPAAALPAAALPTAVVPSALAPTLAPTLAPGAGVLLPEFGGGVLSTTAPSLVAPTSLAPGAGVLAPEFGGLTAATDLTAVGLPQTVESTLAFGKAGGTVPDIFTTGVEKIATPIDANTLASTPGTNLGEFGIGSNTGITSAEPSLVNATGAEVGANTGLSSGSSLFETPALDISAAEVTGEVGKDLVFDSFGESLAEKSASEAAKGIAKAEGGFGLGDVINTKTLLGGYALSSLLENLLAKDYEDDPGTAYEGDPVWAGQQVNPAAFASGGGSAERDYYYNKGGLVGSRRSANRGFYGAYDPYRGRRIR